MFEFISGILNALEDSNITVGLMLDLSKAFDTLSHDLILHKLSAYGINKLDWFQSYLANRRQRVVISQNGKTTVSEEELTEFRRVAYWALSFSSFF